MKEDITVHDVWLQDSLKSRFAELNEENNKLKDKIDDQEKQMERSIEEGKVFNSRASMVMVDQYLKTNEYKNLAFDGFSFEDLD